MADQGRDRGRGVIIRPYRPDLPGNPDREAMYRIFRDTGLLAGPVAPYFPDPEFMAHAMLAYYLRFEPGWALVAEVRGGDQTAGTANAPTEPDGGERLPPVIAGYLTGCPSTSRRNRVSPLWLFPRVAANFLRRGLLFSRGGLNLAFRGGPAYLAELPARGGLPSLAAFPAHLHMAVDPAYQRRGIGRALLAAALVRFREAGIGGVHVETSNKHPAAMALYRQAGFAEVGRHRTRLWDHMLPPGELPVEAVIMARRLD